MDATFVSFGVAFRVVTEGVPSAAVRLALPPGSRRAPRVRTSLHCRLQHSGRRWRLLVDEQLADELGAQVDALDRLEGVLALHVAATAPAHVFIHAGVVAHRGRALILPGRTLSGKSTLVARLVAEGARYYSDEYAVLDREGRVLPYARRLSLRRSRGRPRRIVPRRTGRAPLAAGWVVASRYDPRAPAELSPLSPGRTALVLMDNAVAARLAPERILPTIRKVVARAIGSSATRGEARIFARDILSRCV